MVSDRGGRAGYVAKSRQKAYRALRKHGLSKSFAAAISNGGLTFPQRSAMARRAARTRRAKRGK